MDYKNYMGNMDKIYGTSSVPESGYRRIGSSTRSPSNVYEPPQPPMINTTPGQGQVQRSASSQQQASPGGLRAPFKITESLYTTPNAKNMSIWNKSSIGSGGDVVIASQNYLNNLKNYLSNLLEASQQNSKYFIGMWSPSINTEISTVMKEIENVKNYLYTR